MISFSLGGAHICENTACIYPFWRFTEWSRPVDVQHDNSFPNLPHVGLHMGQNLLIAVSKICGMNISETVGQIFRYEVIWNHLDF